MNPMIRTMNNYKGRYLLNHAYIRLDIRMFDFSEEQLFECAQIIESFIKGQHDAAFVIRYRDDQGHSIRKKPFSEVLQNELCNCEQDKFRACAITYQGFLKTENMRKQEDIRKAYVDAGKYDCSGFLAYSIGADPHRIEFPSIPDPTLLDNCKTRNDYFRSIAEYSQTDKQWLSNVFSYDLQGSITAAFEIDTDNNEQAIGDISLVFSYYMLGDSVEKTYYELRKLAIEIDAIMPFVNASIGFGDSSESSYDLCSQPIVFPTNNNRYEFVKKYGNLLGWFNLIPLSWDKRLPTDYPDILQKDSTKKGSITYELRGSVSPYRAKDLLQIRKFFSTILLPMKKETVYYIHIAPHIAPVEADEINIERHPRTGEYYPVYQPVINTQGDGCQGDGSVDNIWVSTQGTQGDGSSGGVKGTVLLTTEHKGTVLLC